MRTLMRRTAALVLLMVLGAAAVAVAQGTGPKTDAVQATFTLTKTGTQERACTGSDGAYRDARETFAGTITGDPRLTGDLELRTRSLIDQDSGLGTTDGRVRLTDPQTGRTTAVGKLVAVNTQRGVLDGFVDARLTAAHGARLRANVHATFNADGTQVSGRLGTGTSTDTAVVQEGHCSGRLDGHGHGPKAQDGHGPHGHGHGPHARRR
jgi:hypothetical protein